VIAMLEPHRDGAALTDKLLLDQLPSGISWSGKIAYLDRDGVINLGSENYVNSPDEVVILPDAAQCIGQLRRAGFRIVVVTNQSPVGRGHWDANNLHQIHKKIRKMLLEKDSDALLDLILYSPYAPWDGAWSRKPNPGMLEAGRQLIEAAERGLEFDNLTVKYDYEWTDRSDESGSVMVGDRGVDMSAASEFGVLGLRCDSNLGISDVIGTILGGVA